MKKEIAENLYSRIQKCTICKTTNSEKVVRRLKSVNLNSEIFVIAEAMAANQVRVSGINNFDINGEMGNTGKSLEKFVNQFKYSVYPGDNCIYFTEIVHCFPGYQSKGNKKQIRRPSKEEIATCINQDFLQQELKIMNPKIILLMGKVSYETFYSSFLGQKPELNLSRKIEQISNTGKYDKYQNIPIIPIQHASGANPRFHQMLKDTKLIDLIIKILDI